MFIISNGGGGGGGTIIQSGTFNTTIQSGTTVDISTGIIVKSPTNSNEHSNAGIFYHLNGPRDPGQPFYIEGRGKLIHGLTMQAGTPKFTNSSDHFHLFWTTQQNVAWQMIQGGANNSVPNRFIFHTPGLGFTQSFFNEANIFSLDTSNVTGIGANSTRTTTGIKLKYNTSGTINSGAYISLIVNPGMAGIVAGTYNGIVTTPLLFNEDKYEVNLQLDFIQLFNFNTGSKGEELRYTNANGVNSFRLNVYPAALDGIQTNISGNYNNIPFHALVTLSGHSVFVGQSLVLRNTSSLLGVSEGFYDSWVRDVIDQNNFVIEIGSQIHTNSIYPQITGNLQENGWFLTPGNNDPVHRPTANQQIFIFERYPILSAASGIKVMGGIRNFSIGSRSTAFTDDSFCIGCDNLVSASGSSAIGHNIHNNIKDSVEIGTATQTKLSIRDSGIVLPISNVYFNAGTGQYEIPNNGLYFYKSGNNIVINFNDNGNIKSNNILNW